MGEPCETDVWRAAHGSDMDGGSLAKSRLHAGSVLMLSAGWCEGGIDSSSHWWICAGRSG